MQYPYCRSNNTDVIFCGSKLKLLKFKIEREINSLFGNKRIPGGHYVFKCYQCGRKFALAVD